jgi:DNA polymerase-3 subunit epsilon
MDSGRLVHDDVGTFKQLPFALAWAITIHKSQGKTFDKVIIDLGGGTRSNGQLYVALSRARSLEGIVLRQPIRPKHVSVEDDVSRFFARRHLDDGVLANQPLAVLATNVTGHNTNDRIVELAAVIIRDGVVVDEFDTMVHPLRDVTGSWEHGVTATMASMAPSFSEAWAAISPSLEGCVLVAHGLAPLSRQLRQEFKALNMLPGSLGLGVCTKEQTKADLIEACNNYGIPLEPIPNALTNARAIAQLITRLGDVETTFTPMKNLEAGESPPRLQRRPNQPDDLVRNLDSLSTSDNPNESYARGLARFLDDGRLDETERRYLDSLAEFLHLCIDSRREIQERFCTSLVEAAARDEEMTDEEWDYITLVHSDLGIECPTRPPARPDQVVELYRGMEVFFTGFPLDGPGGYYAYVALAKSIGLVEVRDVSSRKCQLVVALDRASTSSRSKKARNFGIPIIHISEFLELVESGVIHDPPEKFDPPPRVATRSRTSKPARKVASPPKKPIPLRPEELPKNRSIGNYSLDQLVSVIALLDPEKSVEDSELLDQCVAFLEFDQRSPQRMRKLSHAIDKHRGEPEGSSRARQNQRLETSLAGDLATKHSRSDEEFVPQPGMGICFTGAAVINGEKVIRKVLQNAAADAGLVVLDDVTASCNVLVYADENARSTKKVKRALAMGIEGMTVERFASLYLGVGNT